MTRKDYELIADVIKPLVKGCQDLTEDNPEAYSYLSLIRELVNNLSDKLVENNPRFDRSKFWKACGL